MVSHPKERSGLVADHPQANKDQEYQQDKTQHEVLELIKSGYTHEVSDIVRFEAVTTLWGLPNRNQILADHVVDCRQWLIRLCASGLSQPGEVAGVTS